MAKKYQIEKKRASGKDEYYVFYKNSKGLRVYCGVFDMAERAQEYVNSMNKGGKSGSKGE